MNKHVIIGMLLALVLIAGCSPKAAPIATPTTDAQVTSVENDIAGIDTLRDDLDTSELDSLDQDLAAVQ